MTEPKCFWCNAPSNEREGDVRVFQGWREGVVFHEPCHREVFSGGLD